FQIPQPDNTVSIAGDEPAVLRVYCYDSYLVLVVLLDGHPPAHQGGLLLLQIPPLDDLVTTVVTTDGIQPVALRVCRYGPYLTSHVLHRLAHIAIFLLLQTQLHGLSISEKTQEASHVRYGLLLIQQIPQHGLTLMAGDQPATQRVQHHLRC